jgi:putative transposase
MLWLMERAAKKTSNDAKFQLWQPENHPTELATPKISWQKLDYTHYNLVKADFVRRTTDWKYSNAIDYSGGKGILDVMLLYTMII